MVRVNHISKEPKFKVGDIVVVRHSQPSKEEDPENTWRDSMNKFLGKMVVIDMVVVKSVPHCIDEKQYLVDTPVYWIAEADSWFQEDFLNYPSRLSLFLSSNSKIKSVVCEERE